MLLFSCSVMFDSLRPPWTAARQASRPFTICQGFSYSCPLSQWCHPTVSSPLVSFSSCLQSFPALGSFQMGWLFTSGGPFGASASVLPMNIQGWFPLGLTGLISLLSKGLSRVFSSIIIWKYQLFGIHPSLWSSCHIHTCLLSVPYIYRNALLTCWATPHPLNSRPVFSYLTFYSLIAFSTFLSKMYPVFIF